MLIFAEQRARPHPKDCEETGVVDERHTDTAEQLPCAMMGNEQGRKHGQHCVGTYVLGSW